MRSNKPYTNVTFTKRVDYDGGAHRPAKTPRGRLVCEDCGAVYLRRHWVLRSDERAQMIAPTAERTTCTACAMIRDGRPGGYLRLDGAYLASHRDAIRRTLRNEANRAAADNPLGRIARWTDEPDALTVTTTTEHLVQRLGQAVNKAFGGTIDYGFSHADKFARATWHRDA